MKRPTPPERDDVEAAGLVHEIAAVDAHHAIRERLLELDVEATIRGGERADDLRRNLGALGFARGWRW